ncbi:MAG: rRNA maturation RNase YbeY [Mangrovibacterium sp.]
MSILFHNEDVKSPKIKKQLVKNWIKSVIASEGKQLGDVNYIFCSDEYLLQVNKQYLNHDYYTDIITFDYVKEGLISGDIFVSVDRIEENGKQYGSGFDAELSRILVHGILHLIGFGDKTPQEKKIMTGKEDQYLAIF